MSDMFGRARFVAPLVALLVAAGCGGGGDSGGGSNAGGGEQAATPMQNPVDPATAGSGRGDGHVHGDARDRRGHRHEGGAGLR